MAELNELNVVTGALGYTGKYIAQALIAAGKRVRTLTGHAHRPNPFGERLEIAPLDFGNLSELAASMRGAKTLFITYWVRFPHRGVTFGKAVENSGRLVAAAKEARVRRIVYISIASASEKSPLPYFRGKALVEKMIVQSGLSYAIIRPTIVFGVEDVLVNNIAWILRRFPVFAVFGSGDYRVQPVFVKDVAEMVVSAANSDTNMVVDAVGPETYTFDELVRLIAAKINTNAKILHLRPGLALFLSKLAGYMVRDVLVTRDEMQGLMSNLLVSTGPATGATRFGEWLEGNAHVMGVKYASELARHYR